MLPYFFMVLQVTMTFTGGYLWHIADSMDDANKNKIYMYLIAWALLFFAFVIILNVHLKIKG